MNMENNLTRNAAQYLLSEYFHLIGQPMPYPCNELPITTISIEKDKNTDGYSVILSHDIFDGDFPDDKIGSLCKTDLMTYLSIPEYL